jgi:alpha-1,2-mannosyltransferase
VPVCLVAFGRWRALLAMLISASLLIVLSGVLFGLDAWVGFIVRSQPTIAAIIEAPWQALPSQRLFVSPLMAARSVSASISVAYCLQVAVALVCAIVAWRAWRIPGVDPIMRASLTGVLAGAASPWVHTYDMIPLATAIVLLVATERCSTRILLGFAWFWPGAVVVLPIPLPLTVVSVASIAWLAWRRVQRGGDVSRTD